MKTKFYLQVYLGNCAFKIVNTKIKNYLDENIFKSNKWALQTLNYDRINWSEGIHPAKSNNSKECMVCHYWFFNHEFKFRNSVCNDCHGLAMLYLNLSDLLLSLLKNFGYCCTFLWH